MSEKVFNTRIIHKHDTEANWKKATNFIPKQGELIVYDIDENYNYSRFKIGDGIRTTNDLEFLLDTQYILHDSDVTLKVLIDALQAEVDGKADETHIHAASDITSGTLASARLPAATSSAIGGVKVGSNINVSSGTISVPSASGSVAGVTIVYPAESCTTFSSDTGTVTPLAVQKGAKMFAITRPTSSTNKAITRYSNATGDVQDSKIIIEDVSNTRDSSKKAQVIAIPAEGGKKMVYGYCTDQIDGTSFIGGVFDVDATEYPYRDGLAIGGTSGNLLWKGEKVATVNDIESAIGAAIAASY